MIHFDCLFAVSIEGLLGCLTSILGPGIRRRSPWQPRWEIGSQAVWKEPLRSTASQSGKAGRKSPLATKNLLEVTDGLRRPLRRGGDAIHQ